MATAPTTTPDRKLVTGGDPAEAFPIPPETQFQKDGDPETLLDFLDAPELERIGRELLRKGQDFMDVRRARFNFRWKLEGGQGGGKVTLGKCVKASGLLAHYSEVDFVIWVAADHARLLKLTRWQVEALLYHELCHAAQAVNQDGEQTGWKTKAHDFEGFRREVEHYGFWKFDLKEAARAMQLRLFELEEGDSDDGEGGEARRFLGKLAPAPGSGIESVTISAGGASVTLTQDDAKKLRAPKGKGRGKKGR